MPRSRSRSPRRRENPRERDRYQKHSPVRNRPRSRTKSPIIRGPSGVKSKNAVNELLLAEVGQTDEMAKLMGFGSFGGEIKNDNERMSSSNNGGGFGNRSNRGGFNRSKIEFGSGRQFGGRGGNQNFGRSRDTFHENRSFVKRNDRPNHGYSDRERFNRTDGFPRRERREEKIGQYSKEEDKPVLRLINPTIVPRRGNYFEHDNREMSPETDHRFTRSYAGHRFEDRFARNQERPKGGKMYDPRYDFSYKPNIRDRVTVSSNYNRDSAPIGWRNFEKRDNRSSYDYDFDSRRRHSTSVKKWGHEEYLKIVHEEEYEGKNMELVEKDSHEEKESHEEDPN